MTVLMMFHYSSFAQDTDPFSYNANIRPSVQAYEMTKYGNLTPSLYTGTFQYSLPLYTYNDPDFEIPVSLEYSFNGYRPSQPSGTVGLGWTLNCGGAITREIVGLPDEYDTTEGSTHIYGYYMFAVVGGAALTTTGEVTTAAGTMLMMNSVNNKNKGYYRGKRIGKNEKYGDSGRAIEKAKKQIEVLEKQKQGQQKKKEMS